MGKKVKAVEPEKSATDNDKPTRGKVIGENFGWTGKLPATLLNEYAQKQKWGRVEYTMRKKKDGFICTVELSWVNPKTREMIRVQMTPDPKYYSPKETTNEARHYGATNAMHRINFIKNMKMVLPSIFASYWGELEAARTKLAKENKGEHDRIYNINPFAVVLEQREKAEKLAKEKLVKQQNEMKVKKPTISVVTNTKKTETAKVDTDTKKTSVSLTPKVNDSPAEVPKIVTFPRKVWNYAPFIDFPSDIRTSIEHSIRKHIDWILKEDLYQSKTTLAASPSSSKYLQILKELNFRESHINEAFKYTSTFVDALEWLLFHLPEDDLPLRFSKTDKDSGVSLTISKDIQSEYLLRRLAQSGCDEDEILQALEENNGNELLASVQLTHGLIENKTQTNRDAVEQTEEEIHELWVQEVEGIELLGSNKIEFVEGYDQRVVNITLNTKNIQPGIFSLRLFQSPKYPAELPGMQIIVNNSSMKLANYIKLSIIKQVCNYILDNGFIGDCFIFCIIEWLEENISRVIDNPGPLLASSQLDSQLAETKVSKSATPNGKRNTRNTTKPLTKQELANLSAEYSARQSSAKMSSSLKQRSTLPAWKKREQLVSIINSNKVTLVTGETGSGKSTQIVQFILDDLNSRGIFDANIICTQPRRISTIGLAERISDERVDSVGKETGYIIRGENKTSRGTRLSFVTTGILLRMLQSFLNESNDSSSDDIFRNLHYIFIDEVHERSIDSDFLLIILKRISSRFPNLKIVLMSATINIEKFKNFFSTPLNHIHIEGRTFPIEDHYLDEILSDLDYSIETGDGEIIKPKASSSYFSNGNLNFDLIANLCLNVHNKLLAKGDDSGSILIFLPGIMEINNCIREIKGLFSKKSVDVWCHPLHSALSSADQKKVFQSKKGTRKIVVSTNIAETSITIPDCVVVIDSGRSKTIFFDPKINTTKLIENWCSKAEIGQRRGRSGRITNGTCYHLYTKETESKMMAQPIPEIMRTRLENLYLIVKSMGISNVEKFLKEGLDAPKESSIKNSKRFLSDIGALNSHDNLTHLGKYLSFLPTDLQSGKLLIFGCIFGCLDVCLTLAAISSTGSPILNNYEMRDKIKSIKTKYSNGQGDLIGMVNVYNDYESQEKKSKFISENCLSYLTLKEIKSVKSQYITILKDLGFVPVSYNHTNQDDFYKSLNRNNDKYSIVRAIITGAYYPQVSQVQFPDPKFSKSLFGSVAVDQDARKNKYWIKNPEYDPSSDSSSNEGKPNFPASRAFIHPSSVMFSSGTSDYANSEEFLDKVTDEDGEIDYEKARKLYDLTPQFKKSNSTIKSPLIVFRDSNHTDKFYVREITPTSTIATLLFGGEIGYDLTGPSAPPGVVVDGWLPIRTWCKNAVLIKRMRKLLDEFIEQQLSNPNQLSGANHDILSIVEQALTL